MSNEKATAEVMDGALREIRRKCGPMAAGVFGGMMDALREMRRELDELREAITQRGDR